MVGIECSLLDHVVAELRDGLLYLEQTVESWVLHVLSAGIEL